ncbi:MAG: hypothetical protein P3C09_11595 [Gemmatimonadota bacterium]|nr:hypothetical protein [Gemmatimonadota bacterium]MDQ8168390.1 hypothetical protein [Gemmatimonadota bacterium]
MPAAAATRAADPTRPGFLGPQAAAQRERQHRRGNAPHRQRARTAP